LLIQSQPPRSTRRLRQCGNESLYRIEGNSFREAVRRDQMSRKRGVHPAPRRRAWKKGARVVDGPGIPLETG
jgi:hypothetical protein